MFRFPAKAPALVKWIFKPLIWQMPTNDNAIYLTFDDGPTPEITQWVLRTLNQYNAKATFFCIGKNVKAYPDILESIKAQKHSVGNHTYTHLKGWTNSISDYVSDTKQAQTLIRPFTATKLMRPPYGLITKGQSKALRKIGYSIIMWDVISYDWSIKTTKENCLNTVLKHTKPGSIIVFHDSVKASENMMYALPKVLAHFSEKGYSFKKIPEQLK